MLSGLNTQQKDALKAPGHVLLTACPGSGKTRVLTFKIAQQLSEVEGTKKTIVALTFTNRAADEIKNRLSRMNVEPKNQLWAGTIHAFCLEWIIRPYSAYLEELRNGFVVIDEYKVEDLLSTLKIKKGLNIFTQITTRINHDGSLAELVNADLVIEYHQILKSQKQVDFDQLIYFSYKLLDKYPKICKTLNNLFHYILVDEYQDTQELQYLILSLIIKAPGGKTTIFFVGDKDQAIYGSLGGKAKTLAEIKNQFGNIDIKSLDLSGNYRTNQRIIDYYRNFQSIPFDIKSLAKNAADPGVIVFMNQSISKDDLAKTISEIIKKHLKAGVPEKEICVLAPQWNHIIPIGRSLKKLLPDVNLDAPGLSPLLKNRENIWFKVARLFLVDPAPNMYITRLRWASELLNELDNHAIHLFPDEDRRERHLLKAINSCKSKNEEGLPFLEECFNLLAVKLSLVIANHQILANHWTTFFESSKKRIEEKKFDYATDTKSFKRMFSHQEGVVINTCHGIKGEEFEVVIAFGLLHGYLPNWGESDQKDAANKLLYVICSRAKQNLYLISESGRTWGRQQNPYSTTSQLQNLKFTYDK